MHIDEFVDGGGGELAADLKVRTADHAHHTPMESRIAMMDAGVLTGFLPGTPYSNGDEWPDFELCPGIIRYHLHLLQISILIVTSIAYPLLAL